MERLRGTLAVLLCIGLLSPSTPAFSQTALSSANQTANRAPARPPYQSGQLHGDERILHALNRFTFGPRPGDLEAARAMGLERWFDRQLHPATLDQSELESRLAQFPAMQASPRDLLFRLPSGAEIRQIADGKAAVPENRALHAIYENELARVELNRQKKAQEKQQQASLSANLAMAAPAMSPAMNSPAMDDSASGKIAPEAPQTEPSGQMSMMTPPANPEQLAFDPAEIVRILALPPEQRVSRLAAMEQPEFDSFRKALKPPQRAALIVELSPVETEFVSALENPQRVVVDELAYQRLTRDLYSNAQLQEVMTDFWLNHFNVYLHKNEETPYYLVSYERDVIRPLAMGKFEDLLEATAHSPAMLLYLDNASSIGPNSPNAERAKAAERNPGAKRKAPEGLNENYARELMELHTLGVNGGFTQADVIQVARIFTGWTVDRPQQGGGFKFDENRHEPGTKKVLGKKFKEKGEMEGRELLHLLATRPATARFLSRELAVRFVSDDPPESLVDRMAHTYLSSGGDISAVLLTLFRSPEFWAAGDYRAKVKTPLEYVVSAARASNATIENLQPLVNTLREMGMGLYGAVPPTGYKWDSSTWVSTGALVSRMNFALALAANKVPGISVDWEPQWEESAGSGASSLAASAEAEEQRLESLLVAGGVGDSTRAAVLEQFETQSAQSAGPAKPVQASAKLGRPAQAAAALARQDQLLAGLLLGSPEFQRR